MNNCKAEWEIFSLNWLDNFRKKMSKEKNIKTYELFKQDRFLGILVHLLTGLGIVAGFFALIAVMNNNQKAAFLWLGFAFLIDSIDGTLARKFNVKKNLPHIDGKMLDSIIAVSYTHLTLPTKNEV